MGAAASSSIGSDLDSRSISLSTASARDVADYVKIMDGGLDLFAANFVSFDVSGDVLSSSSAEEVKQILTDIGIDKVIFQKRLILEINKHKAATLASTPDPVAHVFTAPAAAPIPSSSAAAGIPATSPSPSVLCVDDTSTFSSAVITPPRDILREMFTIHGIECDPSTLDYCVSKLVPVLRERCNRIDSANKRYDCFISYRVDSDKVVADMLYKDIKLAGFNPFIDNACLPFGESWKDNFMLGLCSSKVFIAVMSTAGLGRARNFSVDHSTDNVLLEYQTALLINSRRITEKQPQFILPIHVGSLEGKKLTKFSDSGFGLDQYCNEVKGSASASASRSAPTSAAAAAAAAAAGGSGATADPSSSSSSSASVVATAIPIPIPTLYGSEDLDKFGVDKGPWTYIGDVNGDGMRHGTGTCTWLSEAGSQVVYVGQWGAGRPHGKGIRTDADGSTYDGEWVEGKRQGQGTLVYARGRYEGAWQQDMYHGRGRQTSPEARLGTTACGRAVAL